MKIGNRRWILQHGEYSQTKLRTYVCYLFCPAGAASVGSSEIPSLSLRVGLVLPGSHSFSSRIECLFCLQFFFRLLRHVWIMTYIEKRQILFSTHAYFGSRCNKKRQEMEEWNWQIKNIYGKNIRRYLTSSGVCATYAPDAYGAVEINSENWIQI